MAVISGPKFEREYFVVQPQRGRRGVSARVGVLKELSAAVEINQPVKQVTGSGHAKERVGRGVWSPVQHSANRPEQHECENGQDVPYRPRRKAKPREETDKGEIAPEKNVEEAKHDPPPTPSCNAGGQFACED